MDLNSDAYVLAARAAQALVSGGRGAFKELVEKDPVWVQLPYWGKLAVIDEARRVANQLQ